MARKNGLNRKEQIQCAAGLADGVPAERIAKKFSTSVEVVNRFTKAKMEEGEKKAKARADKQGRVTQARRAKAKVLTEAIKTVGADEASAENFS